MSPINYIGNLSNSYLQSLFGTAASNTAGTGTPAVAAQTENGQLSPSAQLMSTLQQLQQSNPTEYKQVAGQIAANLQNAAKTAATDGYTNLASRLNQLSSDFSAASSSGQLPNVQDLAQALSGHSHHHHGHAVSGDSGSNSTSASTTGSSQIDRLLAAFQTNSASGDSLNPLEIISNTLAGAATSTQS